MILTFIGLTVISAVLALGVFSLLKNLTWRRAPDRYEYRTDAEGNDAVKDRTDE